MVAAPTHHVPLGLAVSCTITDLEEGLILQFQIDGDWENLKKSPPQTQTSRADNLWQSTCFECFLSAVHAPSYYEYNLSPAGNWNTYTFDAYRTGMRPASETLAPRIYQSFSTHQSTRTDVLIPKPESLMNQEILVQPALVLESKAGEISYWASLHPPGKPDFHRREYFAQRF